VPERQRDQLIESLEAAFKEAVAYFEGPGATSGARVGEWGPTEVLCHFLYWHETTARGMESVAAGGGPHRVKAPVDDVNARAIARRSGWSIDRLLQEVAGLQQRLTRAARSLSDLDAVVVVRDQGTGLSAAQRLEIIAGHWREHIAELRSANG